MSAHIDWTTLDTASLTVKSNDTKQNIILNNRSTALATILYTLTLSETKVIDNLSPVDLVGDRVVHGGAKYEQPTIITSKVKQAIRCYKFYGISHQCCADKTAQILNCSLDSLKVITCRLSNGCFLAAINNCVYINTIMGFSPLEGLMMGTRSSSIDPQILLYLMREHDLNANQLNKLLNKESGLDGVSRILADMRAILTACSQGNERAQLLEIFISIV